MPALCVAVRQVENFVFVLAKDHFPVSSCCRSRGRLTCVFSLRNDSHRLCGPGDHGPTLVAPKEVSKLLSVYRVTTGCGVVDLPFGNRRLTVPRHLYFFRRRSPAFLIPSPVRLIPWPMPLRTLPRAFRTTSASSSSCRKIWMTPFEASSP